MREMKDWIRKLMAGGISRREFVERAATGGLSLFSTLTALHLESHAEDPGHPGPHHHHDHDHHHHHHDGHDHHHSPQEKLRARHNPNQTNLNPYEEWLKEEGIPVHRDHHIADLRTAEVKPWKRLGVQGAHIDLVGGEGVNAGYLCEIAPGANTRPQRYLFEEVIYVLSGEGETVVWTPKGPKQSVKWRAGSVLAPPLNVWRQHFNRGTAPARFLSMNNAPVVIDLFHNADFVFNNDYVFRDRYQSEADFFGAGQENFHHKQTTLETSEQVRGVHTWDSGFVPDARTIGLAVVKERGEGNSRVELQLAENTMQCHISEFEVGTYKKAHRHGPGSHVVMLNGLGYTLMWKETLKYSDSPTKVRIDWKEGSLFVPPDGWFHQHFNSGGDPARYLAPTWGGDGKWFMRALGGGGRTHRLGKTSTRKGGNLVEYEDEDPAIREIFEAELKKSGVKNRMRAGKS
ncbi:MAG TPA: ethanolamine ammonia lyase-activating protein [Blastocatellia bacterium]|nr:ethanolamine ammonia lyase-activating protein [Blastocatellia bacterium]